MSRAALAHDTDTQSSKSKAAPSGLRVSQPGDSFEAEADRVAETVSRGGRIAGWSLEKSGLGAIHRQAAPPGAAPAPQALPTSDILPKLAEALMATPAGKDILQKIKDNPAVKGAADFAGTPAGIIVSGSAAIGAVSALAAAHKPLPLQIPKIPLDFVHPGLGVKITYAGPVDHPTGASLTLSFEGKSAEKKPQQTPAEKYRAETARIAADQEKFRTGLRPAPDAGPRPGPVKTPSERAFEDWSLKRLSAAAGFGTKGAAPAPAPSAAPGPVLQIPALESPYKPKAPTLLDKKLELKPITSTAPKPEDAKKEEIPVQRKAERSGEVFADSAEVNAVLKSSGRPLDRETRRYMEARIGFDFSKVRVHTDTQAAASARSLEARAYTVGSHVVFAGGRYAPQSTEGRRLLAHELTHVVQQTSTPQRAHPVVHAAPRHVQREGTLLSKLPDWLLNKIRNLKGYQLFCVLIEQDLITGQQVERNATNLTEGILRLFDGGPELFARLKKAAAAIETAYQWVLGQIRELGLTQEYFSKLVDRLLDVPIGLDTWDRIKEILAEPLNKLIELAARMAKAALDFILEAVLDAFPIGRKVFAILKKAGAVVSRIAADPISFAKNLFAAVQQGFSNFGKNILTHLGDGLKQWIFDELHLSGLKMPEHFDFASILRLVLQVLKLTYEQLRPEIVAKLGEDVVYFFETAGNVLTRIKNEGFAAVWEMIKEKASNLFDSVIDGVKNWVITQIVKVGLIKVAELASPIGDAIEVVRSIYETIKFFIEKASKFVELVDSVVNAFSDIADGKIEGAAQKIEDTMSNSIPLILKFLADQLGLSGIGDSIRKIIDDVSKPIHEAIGKVLDFIVDKAKPIWEKGKEAFLGKLAALKEWWKKPKKFQYGEEQHELSVEGEGDHPQVSVQSTKTSLEHFLKDVQATPKQTSTILKLAGQLHWRQGELQKPADDAKGSQIYDRLRDELDNLKAREAPKSLIKYPQPAHSLGGGQEADAFLSSHRDPGTEPNDTDPPIWNDLGYLRDPSQKFYVRGHLLSMRLGGQGIWRNMMPITNTVNQRMNSQVENKLKQATAPKSNRYFHYNVKAAYDSTVLPPVDDKAPAAEKKQRARDAEKRLLSLSWTVKAAQYDKDGGGWKETDGELLDAGGKAMDARVAQGDFTPPTVRS